MDSNIKLPSRRMGANGQGHNWQIFCQHAINFNFQLSYSLIGHQEVL